MASYHLIPQFLIFLVVVIILLCLVAWWKTSSTPGNSTGDSRDPTTWLLLGLLIVALFGLGAFVMFVLLRFES